MKKLLAFTACLFLSACCLAGTILVKNIEELNQANKTAQPGDVVILQNGTWSNVAIKLSCSGEEGKPIVFKAQEAGKVIISGTSQLRFGGNYITVDGLCFTNGYSPSGPIVDFRINDKQLANNCRFTNCVINDFNKPKRMSEDYWVSLSGKKNRIDHCSFLNKKNLGVLMAVILDDERSRENFHSIDHNYFGVRPPLGSNAGEIIRVGVSQHCQFNSNTQIVDNFFDRCDGETEIISIKSCSNVVRYNVFKESQGDVVLRHGNDNTVESNIFMGNDKEGTGGVRIINRGQWVVNNLFYKCRGVAFRSPLSIMNGVPNSPAFRYVPVTDAVVANNSFYNCTPISFCEGSDAERSTPPSNVYFFNNTFYNNRDSLIYHVYDNISGISFANNIVSKAVPQPLTKGFTKTSLQEDRKVNVTWTSAPGINPQSFLPDSMARLTGRLAKTFSSSAGFSDEAIVERTVQNALTNCGAKWFVNKAISDKPTLVSCKNAEAIYKAIADQKKPLLISLTGTAYTFDKPLVVDGNVSLTSATKTPVAFNTTTALPALFIIRNRGALHLNGFNITGNDLKSTAFIATDTTGSSEHYNLTIKNSVFKNLSSCSNFFYAHKSTFGDSIIIENSSFSALANGFMLADEKDDKGYYNAEKIRIVNNRFTGGAGFLLQLYRGGNDESTMGPDLAFRNNQVSNYNTVTADPLIQLTGVQKTNITGNTLSNSNGSKTAILYKDTVRAVHYLANNLFSHSGSVQKNDFVTEQKNTFQ
jgi:poly(beta-D-mannuronate) lyase